MHNQGKTNDNNRLAKFSFLNFPSLMNGVMRTLKFCLFLPLLLPCLWKYVPGVPRNSKTRLKELLANHQDIIIHSVKVRLKQK